MNIRPMAANDGPDLEDILQIEEQSFVRPWGASQICSILTSDNVSGFVAETSPDFDDRYYPPTLVVGYVIYKIHLSSIYILSIGVLKDARREKVATSLVEKIKLDYISPRRPTIIARVSERNLSGQLFFKSLGFKFKQTLLRTTIDRDNSSEQSFKMVLN